MRREKRQEHEEEVEKSELPPASIRCGRRARQSKNEEERQQTKRYVLLGKRSERIVGGRVR